MVRHPAQHGHVGSRSVLAGQTRGKALKNFTHLVCLDQPGSVKLANKNAEPVDRFDEPEPLQLKQRFPYRALGDAQLPSQALLREPLSRLAPTRQNPALYFFADLVPAHWVLNRHVEQILHFAG
jgi:hypothetical protein